jgi:glycosyltransferase involved in cell wall biosynthesis
MGVRMLQHRAAEPVRLLTVGDLTQDSGLDFLLRATARLVTCVPGLQLSIAGAGPQRASLERVVAALGLGAVVSLPGSLAPVRLVELMQRADVFIVPRVSCARPGVPAALPVAMAGGLCVVATDVGGVPGMLTDGLDGLVVPPADEDALVHALAMAVANADLRRSLGEAAALSIRGLLRSA